MRDIFHYSPEAGALPPEQAADVRARFMAVAEAIDIALAATEGVDDGLSQ